MFEPLAMALLVLKFIGGVTLFVLIIMFVGSAIASIVNWICDLKGRG